MTAGLNNVEFPPCALYTSVNCLLEQRRLYSKTQRCQNCSAHSCKERNKERLSVAAAGMNAATAGIARLCPLMPTKVFTMADSLYVAGLCWSRLGPHQSRVVWVGRFGGGALTDKRATAISPRPSQRTQQRALWLRAES